MPNMNLPNAPSLVVFDAHAVALGQTAANRLLFYWLSDDNKRESLYADMIRAEKALKFESRALVNDGHDINTCCDDDRPKSFRQVAYLVAHPEHVLAAYQHASSVSREDLQWSNTPYKDLGGTFMLAFDEPPENADPFKSHDKQRKYCYALINMLADFFDPIATIAFKAGALVPLRSRNFDLAELSESVAAHYAARLFGYSLADIPLLIETNRKIGNGLMWVNVGQHFISDPTIIPAAKAALAALNQRTVALIDLYTHAIEQAQTDELDDLDEELRLLRELYFENPVSSPDKTQRLMKPKEFTPLMRIMARDNVSPYYSNTEKAILVTSMVGGMITNLKAAVCIAVQEFINLASSDLKTVRDFARDARQKRRDADWDQEESKRFRGLVEEALRINPPAAFVPRRAARDITLQPGGQVIPKSSLIVIGVGGGSWDSTRDKIKSMCSRFAVSAGASAPANHCPFAMAFGGPPEPKTDGGRAAYLHSCFGKDMAMHSITYTVRQVMVLPGLSQILDDKTGEAVDITKRAGLICEKYPLEYQREKLLRQSILQTVLPIKTPIAENAEALKLVLKYGAPFIEKVLHDARHVHFASFLFVENDSKLVLFTAYDGDFDAYIGHFAREFGPLFDRFFSHVENTPRAPIAEHSFEFVQFLKRFQKPPAAGYYFSAYPEATTSQIQYQFNNQRDYDFSDLGYAP